TDINNSVEMFNNKLKEKEVGNLSKSVETVVETEVVEENVVENVEEVETVIETEQQEVEQTEEPMIQEFALSVDNIRNSINSQLKDRTVEAEDWWGGTYQTREF